MGGLGGGGAGGRGRHPQTRPSIVAICLSMSCSNQSSHVLTPGQGSDLTTTPQTDCRPSHPLNRAKKLYSNRVVEKLLLILRALSAPIPRACRQTSRTSNACQLADLTGKEAIGLPQQQCPRVLVSAESPKHWTNDGSL